jgi:hypothetical protein
MSAHSRNPPKLIEHDLDNGQRSPGFLPLSNRHHQAFGATGRADSDIGLNPSAHQERGMSKLIYAGATTLAIFGSIGFAAAQRGPGADHPNLTPTQERTVSQGLAASPSQAAPVGVQPQVGNMLPDSLAAQALPSDVSDRVPEAKQLLFVKLPDRIVLIDPETKLVTEIVMDEVTTGSNPNSSDRPSR